MTLIIIGVYHPLSSFKFQLHRDTPALLLSLQADVKINRGGNDGKIMLPPPPHHTHAAIPNAFHCTIRPPDMTQRVISLIPY